LSIPGTGHTGCWYLFLAEGCSGSARKFTVFSESEPEVAVQVVIHETTQIDPSKLVTSDSGRFALVPKQLNSLTEYDKRRKSVDRLQRSSCEILRKIPMKFCVYFSKIDIANAYNCVALSTAMQHVCTEVYDTDTGHIDILNAQHYVMAGVIVHLSFGCAQIFWFKNALRYSMESTSMFILIFSKMIYYFAQTTRSTLPRLPIKLCQFFPITVFGFAPTR
jgi:uncharacterized protein (DUF486 family)